MRASQEDPTLPVASMASHFEPVEAGGDAGAGLRVAGVFGNVAGRVEEITDRMRTSIFLALSPGAGPPSAAEGNCNTLDA